MGTTAAEDRAKFKTSDNVANEPTSNPFPSRRPKFPYPDAHPPPESFQNKPPTPPKPERPKPRPAYRKKEERVASARDDPERLIDVYPNIQLLETILDAYPHPNEAHRKTYSQLKEYYGIHVEPEQMWKKIAWVSLSYR
jgi:hypothetical protein